MYRFSIQSDWSSMHRNDWTSLLKRIDRSSENHFMEIGSFEGRSSVWLADNYLEHPNSSLTCIDTWLGGEEVSRTKLPYDFTAIEECFQHNIKNCKYPEKVRVCKGLSLEVLKGLVNESKQYSFVYIDGSHKARDVFYDLSLSYLMLKPLGIIICDDYQNNMATKDASLRVAPAVDAFCKIFANEIKFGRTSTQQKFIIKRP